MKLIKRVSLVLLICLSLTSASNALDGIGVDTGVTTIITDKIYFIYQNTLIGGTASNAVIHCRLDAIPTLNNCKLASDDTLYGNFNSTKCVSRKAAFSSDEYPDFIFAFEDAPAGFAIKSYNILNEYSGMYCQPLNDTIPTGFTQGQEILLYHSSSQGIRDNYQRSIAGTDITINAKSKNAIIKYSAKSCVYGSCTLVNSTVEYLSALTGGNIL